MKASHNKLLIICTEDWFYKSHFSLLGRVARRLGIFDISIACNINQTDNISTPQGIRYIPLKFQRNQFKVTPNLKLIKKIKTIIEEEDPDLVHFIALKPILLGGLGALFAKSSVKKVYHLTGMGHVALGQSLREKLIKNIFLKLIALLQRDPNSELILENHDDLDELRKYDNLTDERTTVVGGAGINPRQLRELPSPQCEIVKASFVGRMIHSKGVDVAIEACKILERRNVKFHLDLVGQPDFGNPRPYSKQQLENWNTLSNVSWKGPTNDIREVWKNSHIAIVPSRGGEGLPKCLLEAAACGKPIVATDVPGCREFVREGKEGFLVPPNDPDQLANAIEKLVSNILMRKKLGQAARHRVLENFTEEIVGSAISSIYHRALDLSSRQMKNIDSIDNISPEESSLNIHYQS